MDDLFMRVMQLSQKGYVCSQIIMQIVLDMRNEKNDALIRSLAGLAYGCGSGIATCGALTGAACVVGYYAAKGSDEETGSEKFGPMLEQLTEWFDRMIGDNHPGITCESIVPSDGSAVSMRNCGTIVVDTLSKTLEILVENDFDLTA